MEPKVATEWSDPAAFRTTQWNLIFSAGGDFDERGHAALAELCQVYWRPIFAFLCRRGHSDDDAQDLTQDFFVMVLEGDLLQRADPNRGRFRSLLLKALQNFVIDEHGKRSAIKRGGAIGFIAWDNWMGEAPSHLTLPSQTLDSWTAERLFDVRWAATVVERALARLRDECESRGRRRVFDALSSSLSSDRSEISYEQLGQTLGVNAVAVKRLLFQLRRRYRELLREEVADTLEDEADIEDEIRYLCTALAAGASR